MSAVFCFLGAVSRYDGPYVYANFIRNDGFLAGELPMPKKSFNIIPPIATVIIAKALVSDVTSNDQFEFKFRPASKEEVEFFDRVEMPAAMNMIKIAKI